MTIYDIAKEARVSASSVSRVINDKPGVNSKTRELIQEVMKKHNYSPSALARGLVNQSSKTIGILVADIRNIHHTDCAYYIEQELSQAGYCSIIMNTGTEDKDKCTAVSLLERRRVEGVVMMGSVFQSVAVSEAISRHLSKVPVVIVNGTINLPNVYSVLSDEQGGVEQCVELLVAKGRTRIAFACDHPLTPSNLLKERGFLHSIERNGLNGHLWNYGTSNSLQGGYDVTLKILNEHPDVDGIIYAVDLLAAGGIHALTDNGVNVPNDIAVIGINNSAFAEICAPQLTSLDNKRLDSSKMAARILLDEFNGKTSAKRIMLLPDLIERGST